jgi:hypothetical protein
MSVGCAHDDAAGSGSPEAFFDFCEVGSDEIVQIVGGFDAV